MINDDLERLEEDGRPIRLGVSGAGWIASGFLRQVSLMKGMQIAVVADQDVSAARKVFESSGVPADGIQEAETEAQAMDALRAGLHVVTPSYSLAAQLDSIDIVADLTASPAIGAETAYACIQYGKDVVLVNVEADVTVGRALKRLARDAGVLYTVSSGDEPGCLMELWDFVTSLGYEPIVIGKGKNNPLDPSATPDTVAESARNVNKDPYQVASYVDGTKTMFEMACAANATGCRPMQRGMVGPEASLATITQVFALEEDGGITKFPRTVEFVQGSSMAGGVFIVVRIEDSRIRDDLEYLKVGNGRYYSFVRPYHLWFLEAPISIARAYIHREVALVPLDTPTADVMAVAKRDLKAGDCLDTFGGFTQYGLIEEALEAQALHALPIGLAPGAVVARSVSAGSVITWDDVHLDESQTLVKLRRMQDQTDTQWLAKGPVD